MKINELVLLLLLVKFGACELESCIAPDGKPGFCLNLKDCKSHKKYFNTEIWVNPDEHSELLSRDCTLNVLTPKTCCSEFNDNLARRYSAMSINDFLITPTAMNLPKVSCGKSTESNTSPWMAVLVSENPDTKNKFVGCTGTLISDRDLLFPTRCLDNIHSILLGFEKSSVTRECIRSDSCAFDIKIKESDIIIKRHPDYSYLPIGNNIAIVRSKISINSPKVSPICLPIHSDEIFQKQLSSFDAVEIHGFTYTVPMKYLEAQSSLIPSDLCQMNYNDHYNSSVNYCLNTTTLREGADFTQSLHIETFKEKRSVLFGIMSYGNSLKFKKPDVFTNIRSYLGWILENLVQQVETPTTTQKPTSSLEQIMNHKNIGLLTLDDCGPILPSKRVAKGNETRLYEYPWFAMLRYEDDDFKCGGSIITDRFILTAGHCFTGPKKIMIVRVGEYRLSTKVDCEPGEDEDDPIDCAVPYQDIDIDKIITHPEFDPAPGSPNDIALIRLKKTITYHKSVKRVCLPILPQFQNLITPSKTIVAGYGLIDTGTQRPDVLIAAVLEPVSFEICQQNFSEISAIKLRHDLQYCAGGKNLVGSCSGDSGGPIVSFGTIGNQQKFVQYGIVSAGIECAAVEGFPGIYVRVTAYLHWILDNID